MVSPLTVLSFDKEIKDVLSRALPNGPTYCGVLDTRRLDPVGPADMAGHSGKAAYVDEHDWQLTTECDSAILPFACETKLT